MGAEARSVVVRLSMETAQAMRASKEFGAEVTRSMSQAEKATGRSTKALDTLGRQGGRAALAAAAGLTFLAKSAVDFESQFAGVEKTVDGTAAQLGALEGGLRDLAKTMPSTHEEILGVAEAAGQLGVAREDITSFTETMVQLGETTNLTAQDAATSIAQMANVMGTAPDEIAKVGAALVALGNDGASTEAEILQMAQRIAGAGAQIGLAEADILAIANAAASMGINAEAGGSAISRVFTELAKATAQGGEKLVAFSEVAGMTASEFAAAFEADPARAFESFTSGLDQINKSGGDVFTTLDQLGLSDVRVSQALLGMAASGDLLSDSLTLGAKAFEENTALTDEYAKRLDTTAAEARVAWNQIKDAGIEAGAALLPILSKAAGVVGDLAEGFTSLPGPVQDSLTGMLGITAVLGGGLWFTSKVVSGVVNTKNALADLGITSDKIGGQLGAVGRTAGPILAVAAAVTILGNEWAKASGARLDPSELNRDLEALAGDHNSELLNRFSNDLQKTNSTIGTVVEPVKELATVFGLFGDTDLDISNQNIEEMDEALAGLVESGDADKASELFEKFSSAAQEAGKSLDDVNDAFPEYQQAVDNLNASTPGMTDKLLAMGKAIGIEQAQALEANADAWDAVVAATAAGGDAAALTTEDINTLTQAMRDQASAALGAFDATTAWGEAVAAARAQAKTGEQGLDEFTEAGRNNRTELSNLAATWNSQPKAVKNSQAAYRDARQTFLEVADAMGVGDARAKRLVRSLLDMPRKTVAEIAVKDQQAKDAIDDADRGLENLSHTRAEAIIAADNAEALNAIEQTKRLLGLIPDENVYIRVQRLGATGAGPNRLTPAGGGHVTGEGTSTSDSIPAMLSNNEYVVKAAAVDRYGVNMMHDINSMRFASGGFASRSYARDYDPRSDTSGLRQPINERAHIDNLLEILNIQAGILDLKKSLGADGKDKLEGIKRRIAELELKRAEKELKLAKNAEEREQREKARDAMRQSRDDLRGVGSGLSFDGLVPDNRPVTVAGEVAGELSTFRRDIIAAGGKWSKSLQRWATELLATARQLDAINAQIVAETAARDQLLKQLDDQQAALDELTSTMESFSDQVASNFLDSPFNQSGSDAASPELAAAQAELAAIRASATGDSIAAAAQASNLIALIARLGGSSSNGAGGLAAFDATVAANTKAARDMARALQTLQEKGLDTDGPMSGLFEELARSGDLATATQLAELSAAEIDAREKAFAESQNQAAITAAFATQARYGSDHAELVAQVVETTAAISAVDATLASLQATADALGEDVRAGAEAGVAALQPQIEKLTQAITQLPRKLSEAAKKDRP